VARVGRDFSGYVAFDSSLCGSRADPGDLASFEQQPGDGSKRSKGQGSSVWVYPSLTVHGSTWKTVLNGRAGSSDRGPYSNDTA
jgi:hypothetical protein